MKEVKEHIDVCVYKLVFIFTLKMDCNCIHNGIACKLVVLKVYGLVLKVYVLKVYGLVF